MPLAAVEVRWPNGATTMEPLWRAYEAVHQGAELVDQSSETAAAVIEDGEARRQATHKAILGDAAAVPGHYPDPGEGKLGQVARLPGRFER